MIRVKFVRNYKQYKKGDTESFTNNVAFGLIDSGQAVVSKDMTEADQVTTSVPSVFVNGGSALYPKRARTLKTKEK